MSVGTELNSGQAIILARALLSDTDPLSVAQSQFLIELKLSDDDFIQMNALASKATEGILTPEEADKIADYLQVGNLLEELKSRARKTLRDAGLDPR